MNEKESRHLREKLSEWQHWSEKMVGAGLIDIEKMPPVFDKASYALKMDEARTIGSHCVGCKEPFGVKEIKVTEDHLNYYHPDCKNKLETSPL